MKKLMPRNRKFVGALLVIAIAAIPVLAQDHQPGTFKRNLAKSKYEPGPAPKDEAARTFEDRGGGVWLSFTNTVPAEPIPRIYTAFKRDGKDYPLWIKGATTWQVISFHKVGPRSWQYIVKTDGKEGPAKTVETFSPDGKTYTVEVTGTNAQGKPIHNVEIWEKQ
jgi:hypothetical protein